MQCCKVDSAVSLLPAAVARSERYVISRHLHLHPRHVSEAVQQCLCYLSLLQRLLRSVLYWHLHIHQCHYLNTYSSSGVSLLPVAAADNIETHPSSWFALTLAPFVDVVQQCLCNHSLLHISVIVYCINSGAIL